MVILALINLLLEDPMLILAKTESNLANEEFFNELLDLVGSSFKKGLKTPCFLIFVLSNEQVQSDLYKLFGENELKIIEDVMKGLLVKGSKLVKKEKYLLEDGILDSTKIEPNHKVFLNFTFYKKNEQKALRVIEYINVVLAVAVKHCRAFSVEAGNLLNYSHEFGIEILSNLTVQNFLDLNGENTLQTLINCYNSLFSRIILLSLYKVGLNMQRIRKEMIKRDKIIIENSFLMVIKQFYLQREFKRTIFKSGLFLKETYELYLFLFSAWWLKNDYINRLMNDQEMVMMLLENANTELSLRFLVSLFTICGINAFPARQISEIIVKGLAFSDKTGKMLLNSGRIDVYQEIIGKEMKKVIYSYFDIKNNSILLAEESDGKSYYEYFSFNSFRLWTRHYC